MRAHAVLAVGPAGRIERMVDSPPVAFRATHDGTVHLVGTAGGPAGDDHVEIDVEVAAGAALRLRSAAATVVYAGAGTAQELRLTAGAGSHVDWAPEPLIVTAGAVHAQRARISLDASARLDWTDVVVLGRHGEGPGSAELRLEVDLAGCPLLRHHLRVGLDAPGWDGPAVLDENRATAVRLVAGPGCERGAAPRQGRHGPGFAWMPLDGPGWLLVAVGADLPALVGNLALAGDPPAT